MMQLANIFKSSMLLFAALLMTVGSVSVHAEDMPAPQTAKDCAGFL